MMEGWSSFRMFLAAVSLVLSAFLGGCDDMHRQPSFGPQEAPRKAPPAEAVSQRGKEFLDWGGDYPNPVAATEGSTVAATEGSMMRGRELYRINCLLCHGGPGDDPGRVGEKLNPPPPLLDRKMIRALSDSDLFKRIGLGFGRMPPFKKRLSPAERWDIVNYLRREP